MERTGRVLFMAGTAMLALALLIGAVEGIQVLDAGSWAYFVPWLVAYVVCLGALVRASVVRRPPTRGGVVLLLAPAVLATSALVLLSPNRNGMASILLVIVAATAALHLSPRAVSGVILAQSLVIAASAGGLGPLAPGGTHPVEVLLSVLLYGLLQAGSAGTVWSQERVAEALQEVSVAHVELRGTSALLAESSQAAERLRISRELHDVLGHQLTALALELEIASHRAEGPERDHVLRARGMAKGLLSDVRAVVGTERHRSFDLEQTLSEVVGDVPRPRTHLEVHSDLDLADEHATALVRAVQEITTNAIRHSQAENLWFRITGDGGRIRLQARDDGVGATDVAFGNGLRGLTERVLALGGTVEFDGTDGFRVLAELPVREAVPA